MARTEDGLRVLPPSPVREEERPLLDNADFQADHGTIEQGPDGREESDVPIPAEPSTKKIVLIIGSMWLGSFFAALGQSHTVPTTWVYPTHPADTIYIHRLDYRRYACISNQHFVPLFYAPLVDRFWLSYRERSAAASVWSLDGHLWKESRRYLCMHLFRSGHSDMWACRECASYDRWKGNSWYGRRVSDQTKIPQLVFGYAC